MNKSKSIISLLIFSYVILLGHLSFPEFGNLTSNHVKTNKICDHKHHDKLAESNHTDCQGKVHHHESADSDHTDFHNKNNHHCGYCCENNNDLEFTLNDKSSKDLQIIKFTSVVVDIIEIKVLRNTEPNQLYLQNVFKLPIAEHTILPTGLRAPPQV